MMLIKNFNTIWSKILAIASQKLISRADAQPEIRNGGRLFWGSGGGAPSSQKFCIFCKINL